MPTSVDEMPNADKSSMVSPIMNQPVSDMLVVDMPYIWQMQQIDSSDVPIDHVRSESVSLASDSQDTGTFVDIGQHAPQLSRSTVPLVLSVNTFRFVDDLDMKNILIF